MKRTLFLLLVCCALLVSCSADEPSEDDFLTELEQEADDTSEQVDESGSLEADESVPVQEDESDELAELEDQEEAEEETKKITFNKADLSHNMDIRVSEMSILGTRFTDDEIHELRLFLSTLGETDALSLEFLPACSQEPAPIVLVVNDELVETIQPECGTAVSIDISVELIENGANTIAFKSHAREDYAVEDVVLRIVRGDDEEVMQGDTFIFERSPEEEVELEDIDGFQLTSQVVREFDLDIISGDLSLKIPSSERKGSLLIALNGYELFSGELSGGEMELVLPESLLLTGTNTLVFSSYLQ